MKYGKYLFSSKFQQEAMLPEYKGSTFRGVFGHALKKVTCALKRESCEECLLRGKCVYAFVYETPPLASANEKTRISSPPHPYVIEPPPDVKTHYGEGEPFDFSLLLFGKANDYLPYFIYAFKEIGKVGLGKGKNGKRGAFSLREVHAGEHLVYNHEDDKMKNDGFIQELTVDAPGRGDAVRTLELTLVTPLRLKYQNSLEATLPFHVLTRAMLRRISTLCNYHGTGEPALDYRGLVQRAAAVEVTQSALRWFDWKRYSNRQEQSMMMGGMSGKITYSGDLTEYMPLLEFCEKVHLGKQTSFGLGKIGVTSDYGDMYRKPVRDRYVSPETEDTCTGSGT